MLMVDYEKRKILTVEIAFATLFAEGVGPETTVIPQPKRQRDMG
jgi:hypothetical protein